MPADYNPAGLKAVHYSDDGTDDSWTKINGEVVEAENLPETGIDQETTNSSYQSGVSINPTVRYSDHQDKATIKALNRTPKFFALEYFDGTIHKTEEAVYPKVLNVPKPRRADGDSLWQLSFMLDSDSGYEEIDSLTS